MSEEEIIKEVKGYLEFENGIKEIEELKEKNKHITKETVEFVNSHYISKDKIRELIDKINIDGYSYQDCIGEIIELLEERN